MNREKNYYDPTENEDYLTKLESIKMKRFYGKHLSQCAADTAVMGNQGTYGNMQFAPLQQSVFYQTTRNGFGTSLDSRKQPHLLLSMAQPRATTPANEPKELYKGSFRRGLSVNPPRGTELKKAENDRKYKELTSMNATLLAKLSDLQGRLKHDNEGLEDIRRRASAHASAFKAIAQKHMGSEAKVRRMFHVPKEDSLFGEDELANARGKLNDLSAAIKAQREKR